MNNRIARIAMAAITMHVFATPAAGEYKANVVVDARAAGVTIRPEIYGQFAEQLGTGINGGIWVGPDSPIPNIRGYRRDVVEALQLFPVSTYGPDLRL